MRDSVKLLVAAFGTIILTGLMLALTGCAEYPDKRYYELDDAIRAAETQEEKDFYEKKARRMEQGVEEAQRFIEQYNICLARGNSCEVWCSWSGPSLRDPFNFKKHDISDVDKLYRWWMRVKPPTCGFVMSR